MAVATARTGLTATDLHGAAREENKTLHDKLAETLRLAEADLQHSGTLTAALLPEAELRATKAEEAATAAESTAKSDLTDQTAQDALKAANENAITARRFAEAVKLVPVPLALARGDDAQVAAKKADTEEELTVAKLHLAKAEAEHIHVQDEATRLAVEAARERVRMAETVRSAFAELELFSPDNSREGGGGSVTIW